METNSAITLINDQIREDANVIFGTVIDPKMNGEVAVTVIATGVDEQNKNVNPMAKQLTK